MPNRLNGPKSSMTLSSSNSPGGGTGGLLWCIRIISAWLLFGKFLTIFNTFKPKQIDFYNCTFSYNIGYNTLWQTNGCYTLLCVGSWSTDSWGCGQKTGGVRGAPGPRCGLCPQSPVICSRSTSPCETKSDRTPPYRPKTSGAIVTIALWKSAFMLSRLKLNELLIHW